jgi:putative FmdB family regulatory protein
MPTYEYECEKCGYVFEEYQSITAEPLKKCPKEGCGGAVHRLFSAGGGFIFKGSGFYATDYRSDSYKKSAKSESAGPTPATPAKPESAPAAGGKKPADSAASPTAVPASSGKKSDSRKP